MRSLGRGAGSSIPSGKVVWVLPARDSPQASPLFPHLLVSGTLRRLVGGLGSSKEVLSNPVGMVIGA